MKVEPLQVEYPKRQLGFKLEAIAKLKTHCLLISLYAVPIAQAYLISMSVVM